MTKQDALRAPFVVRDLADASGDLLFFRTLPDILADRFDRLWSHRYEAWDSAGRRFELERVTEGGRFSRLLGRGAEHLVLRSIESDLAPDDIIHHVWWLAGPAAEPLGPEASLRELATLVLEAREREAEISERDNT